MVPHRGHREVAAVVAELAGEEAADDGGAAVLAALLLLPPQLCPQLVQLLAQLPATKHQLMTRRHGAQRPTG